MDNNEPDVSDWIQYLISVRSINNTLMIAYISAMLGIISLMIIIFANFGFSQTGLSIIVALSIPLLIFALYFKLAISNREMSRKMLQDIMKGKRTNPSDIKNEWLKPLEKENN